MKNVEDWSLSTKVFQRIKQTYGSPDVDLMASTQSRKVPFFFSSHRKDEEALALDSLSRDVMWNAWTLPYLFPPFPLIAACLNKIQDQAVEKIIMILPFWPGKAWFSDFQKMALSVKRLPVRKDLVLDMLSQKAPPNIQSLKLVVAVLTGKVGALENHCQTKPGVLLNQVGEILRSPNIQVPGMLGSNGLLSKEYHQLPQL